MFIHRCLWPNKSDGDDSRVNFNSYDFIERYRSSQFEDLPNELVFIIFEYLFCHDILYAFNQLNSRFQFVLHSYLNYHLNFHCITMKSIFNLIQQLPINIQHIKSLTLSNKNKYSCSNIEQCLIIYQIELFYPRLQSLSLIESNDEQLLDLIFLLPSFQKLKYLLISKNSFIIDDDRIIKCIRRIILFKIKTLKYLTWDTDLVFFENEEKALSLEKSTIENYEFRQMNFDDIEWLNSCTRSIKSITINQFNSYSHSLHQQQLTCQTLTSLKINLINNIQFLFDYLKYLTRLKHLEFICHKHQIKDHIDGHKWKYFIRKYIPQLTTFKFLFIFYEFVPSTTIDQLIQPYMTNFWLIEKKWFVSCDHYIQFNRLDLYTIPYMNNKLDYSISCQRKSTTINNTSNIHELILEPIKTQNLLFKDRFTNLQSLTLWDIADSITYDQLDTFLNISSITNITFRSQINSNLFLNIMKYNTTPLVLGIHYKHLLEILHTSTSRNYDQIIYQLRKIKKLTIHHSPLGKSPIILMHLTKKEIKNIWYFFSNIEQLIIEIGLESIVLIPLLLHKLEHLSLLSVYCTKLEHIEKDNIRQWLIEQSRGKLNENNFSCKWHGNEFYIWIDRSMGSSLWFT